MNRREEEEYSIQERIAQEPRSPSTLVATIVVIGFFAFILGLPAIIDRLGK